MSAQFRRWTWTTTITVITLSTHPPTPSPRTEPEWSWSLRGVRTCFGIGAAALIHLSGDQHYILSFDVCEFHLIFAQQPHSQMGRLTVDSPEPINAAAAAGTGNILITHRWDSPDEGRRWYIIIYAGVFSVAPPKNCRRCFILLNQEQTIHCVPCWSHLSCRIRCYILTNIFAVVDI